MPPSECCVCGHALPAGPPRELFEQRLPGGHLAAEAVHRARPLPPGVEHRLCERCTWLLEHRQKLLNERLLASAEAELDEWVAGVLPAAAPDQATAAAGLTDSGGVVSQSGVTANQPGGAVSQSGGTAGQSGGAAGQSGGAAGQSGGAESSDREPLMSVVAVKESMSVPGLAVLKVEHVPMAGGCSCRPCRRCQNGRRAGRHASELTRRLNKALAARGASSDDLKVGNRPV